MRACAPCVRRAQLLKTLTPDLDRRPAGGRPAAVLTLDDDAIVHALRGDQAERPVALRRSDDDLLTAADREHRELGVEAICRHDAAYPARLLDLHDPPAVLHVLGGLERLQAVLGVDGERSALAVVGSRRGPADQRAHAGRFAEAFARAGHVVVSGMAFGVDAAAHEGALAALAAGRRAGGPPVGRTLAVLGGGVDRPTPASLRHLYARIARDGAVVSELPPGATPRRWSFPARNRLIAALGDGLVVVAAATGSGSLTTAKHADDLGRPVGVLPGPLTDPACAGSNELLRYEARPLIVPDDMRTVMGERWGQRSLPPIVAVDALAGLEGAAREIAEALQRGPRTIEALIAGRDPAAVLAGLGALEAAGRLRRSLSGDLELLPAGVGGRT